MFAIHAKASYFFGQEAGKRMNDGGKIVTIVKFLVTDGWWITGQTIFANGGIRPGKTRLVGAGLGKPIVPRIRGSSDGGIRCPVPPGLLPAKSVKSEGLRS
jgi:hypothetical protein